MAVLTGPEGYLWLAIRCIQPSAQDTISSHMADPPFAWPREKVETR